MATGGGGDGLHPGCHGAGMKVADVLLHALKEGQKLADMTVAEASVVAVSVATRHRRAAPASS